MSEQLLAGENEHLPELNKFTFRKAERLCSQKAIEQLFIRGKHLQFYPFRITYLATPQATQNTCVHIAVSVPKKAFKRAVKRNLIKRRIREVYRKYKNNFYTQLPQGYDISMMLIYVSSTIASYAEIETKLTSALDVLAKRIKKSTNTPLHSAD